MALVVKPFSSRTMPLTSAAAVGVVDPVHGHLVDAKSAALCENEQFSVEEPAGIGDMRQQFGGHVGADRLEPALCIRKARGQRGFEQQVVAARDDLALRAADHTRASR